MITINEMNCRKPNMAALEGEWGRRIFEVIRDTPKTDFSRQEMQCEEVEARIKAAQKNGSF